MKVPYNCSLVLTSTIIVALVLSSSSDANSAKPKMISRAKFGLRVPNQKRPPRRDLISIPDPAASHPFGLPDAGGCWLPAWLPACPAVWLEVGHSFSSQRRKQTFGLRVKWLKAGAALHENELKWRRPRHRWSEDTCHPVGVFSLF